MNEYAFLKATKPPVSKSVSRSAKVQWYGLNMNAHADTGFIVDGENFYVTADGTLRAVDVPYELMWRTKLGDNKPVNDTVTPLGFMGIDGKLFFVYFVDGTATNVDIVRITDIVKDKETNNYTCDISHAELSNDDVSLAFSERSLARYNVWTGNSNVINGVYNPRLLIYPDAEWLDFKGDWDSTKAIQCFEIIETTVNKRYVTQETFNSEVFSADDVDAPGKWYYDEASGGYIVFPKADGVGKFSDESEEKRVYGYSDDNTDSSLPAEKKSYGKSAVTYTVSETGTPEGEVFRMLTRETVVPETIVSYSYAGSRYRIIEKTTVEQKSVQKIYMNKVPSVENVINGGDWCKDENTGEYVVYDTPTGKSESISKNEKDAVYKEVQSSSAELPAEKTITGKTQIYYEEEEFVGSDGTVTGGMLTVTEVTPTTRIAYRMDDLGSPVPAADFITPWNNRIFGVDGTKIFASAAGSYVDYDLDTADDFDGNNAWYSATQSGGDFTHICTYGGRPVAFKADMLYELYNDKNPFRIKEISRIGTFNGASVCEVNSTLFYANKDGIYAYGGSYPYCISDAVIDRKKIAGGKLKYGVAGSHEGRYLIREPLVNEDGKPILVFDTATKTWSVTNVFNNEICYFAECDGGLYAALKDGKIYRMDTGNKSGTVWYFETPVITEGTADRKVLEKIQMLVKFHGSGEVRVSVKYDNDVYEPIGELIKDAGVHPLYCKVSKSDHAVRYIKFDCVGDIEILTFEQFLSQGGDR